jgi:hypothetical protein
MVQPEPLDVGYVPGAARDRDRDLDQDHAPVDPSRATRADHDRQRGGQPDPVRQAAQQHRPGMPHHPVPVRDDFQTTRPTTTVHPEGAPTSCDPTLSKPYRARSEHLSHIRDRAITARVNTRGWFAQVTEDQTHTLAVRYSGSQPVPDTFKDGSEAIVEGQRLSDGSFDADHIQAKCASKYEAEYGKDAQHPTDVDMNGGGADNSAADGQSY